MDKASSKNMWLRMESIHGKEANICKNCQHGINDDPDFQRVESQEWIWDCATTSTLVGVKGMKKRGKKRDNLQIPLNLAHSSTHNEYPSPARAATNAPPYFAIPFEYFLSNQ